MGILCFVPMIAIMFARASALLSFMVRRAVGGKTLVLSQMLFLLLLDR
jgi:hypothetical protein